MKCKERERVNERERVCEREKATIRNSFTSMGKTYVRFKRGAVFFVPRRRKETGEAGADREKRMEPGTKKEEKRA